MSDQLNVWMVVWTESRAERKVASRIAARGIELWIPTVTERHRWSDRWRDVAMPLFPGYLFARTGLSGLPSILRTPGVLTVVKSGGRPALLADGFVTSLRRAVDCLENDAMAVDDVADYRVGQEVVVQNGPLSGMRGVVRQLRGGRHLVIWVEAVGRGVAFLLKEAEIRPASVGTARGDGAIQAGLLA